MKPNTNIWGVGTDDCYKLISYIIKFMNEGIEYSIITQETREGVKYPLQPMVKSCALEKVIVTDTLKKNSIIEKRRGCIISTLDDMGNVGSIDFHFRQWNESDIFQISVGKKDKFRYISNMTDKRIILGKYTENSCTNYYIVPK